MDIKHGEILFTFNFTSFTSLLSCAFFKHAWIRKSLILIKKIINGFNTHSQTKNTMIVYWAKFF